MAFRDGWFAAVSGEIAMREQLRAVAFDLDESGLLGLQEALPGWVIESVDAATTAGAAHDWNPGTTDLLVVMARDEIKESLALCRLLVTSSMFATRRADEILGTAENRQQEALEKRAVDADAPLLVLLRPGQESLKQAALDAGADGCLILPVHAKQLTGMLAQTLEGNRPGRHTLSSDRPQCDDRWRDDGGQG